MYKHKKTVMSSPIGNSFTQEIYRCPATGQALRYVDGMMVSCDGAMSYSVCDGCICFLARDYEEDEAAIGIVRKALNQSDIVGWRAAIDEAYVPGTAGHRYITEKGRAGFLDLLTLDDRSTVLEIGCSMGQHTQELAARCGRVFGLDVVLEQAMFTAKRCSQQAITNVSTACGGDDGRLPYASESFDAVVLNLVLEWCGARSDESHEVVQQRLLNETWRVLKPGAQVFLSTKNRYSLSLLLGARDEHLDGMRFGSVLPRSVQRLLLARRGVRRPAGNLHSYGRLREMVSEAGFDRLWSYWASPEMRYPKRFIPTDTASVRSALRAFGSELVFGRKQRVVLSVVPRTVIKYLTPGLCIVASKESYV